MSEVVLILRFSSYSIPESELGVPNSQALPISRVVLMTRFTISVARVYAPAELIWITPLTCIRPI